MSGFKKAIRPVLWAKVLLSAVSGGGKSYTALRLATGMRNEIKAKTGKDTRIAFIGSESQRDLVYAKEFDYDVLHLEAPFTPELYVQSIQQAIDAGYEILIVDSLTHEWSGAGGVLDIHSRIPGNSYTAWSKVTPRHNDFLETVIESPIHLIATVRAKDKVVLEEVNGKQVPKKVGVGYDQRDNLEYLFTVSFQIDRDSHIASEFKDNTHLFENSPRVLTERDGVLLYNWCADGDDEAIKKRDAEMKASKEQGKKLMEEDLPEDVASNKKATTSVPSTPSTPPPSRQKSQTPIEDEIEVEVDVKVETKEIDDPYAYWQEAYKKAKAKGMSVAQVKEVIKACGIDAPKKDTDPKLLIEAAELLNKI